MNNKSAYLTTVIAFVSGIAASVQSGDWTWFSRSGCFVVVVGIWLTSTQILAHNLRLRRRRPLRQRHDPSDPGSTYRATHDWAGGSDDRSILASVRREEDAWEVEVHGLYLLIIGTLVWGFGDLMG